MKLCGNFPVYQCWTRTKWACFRPKTKCWTLRNYITKHFGNWPAILVSKKSVSSFSLPSFTSSTSRCCLLTIPDQLILRTRSWVTNFSKCWAAFFLALRCFFIKRVDTAGCFWKYLAKSKNILGWNLGRLWPFWAGVFRKKNGIKDAGMPVAVDHFDSRREVEIIILSSCSKVLYAMNNTSFFVIVRRKHRKSTFSHSRFVNFVKFFPDFLFS